jgi:hypothetical protein
MVCQIRVVLVLMALTLLAPQSTGAQPRGSRYFPGTGFIVAGAIFTAFNQYGGVPVIGLPISDVMETQCEQHPCMVQWFERTRIEVHHDDGQAYRGRIGADFLAQRGTPWQFGNDTVLNHPTEGPCLGFIEADARPAEGLPGTVTALVSTGPVAQPVGPAHVPGAGGNQ